MIFSHVPRAEARAAIAALVTALVLLGVKYVAYLLTGSAAIFTDALESIVNVVAASVAAYALAYAHRPADESHPYGHGKIEFVSSAFEGGMILIAGGVAAANAIQTLLSRTQQVAHKLDIGVPLMIGALVVNGAVGLLLIRTGRRHKSVILQADGWHLLSDAITSVAVLIGLLLVKWTGAGWIDGATALLTAGYIALVGLRLARHSFAGLMDEQDIADQKTITALLDAHVAGQSEPAICGYHKLRMRHSGRYHWVDFHIQVPHDWPVARGHAIASAIEREIQDALGEGNATAHVEPCTTAGCGHCRAPATPTATA